MFFNFFVPGPAVAGNTTGMTLSHQQLPAEFTAGQGMKKLKNLKLED